jgi:hypothetical protein
LSLFTLHILSILQVQVLERDTTARIAFPTSFKSIHRRHLAIQKELRPSLLAMSDSPSVLDKAQDAATKLAATVADKLNISGSGDVQAKEGE